MKKLISICLLVVLCTSTMRGSNVIMDTLGVKIEQIDSATFYAAKKRVNPKPQVRRKITDIKQVKKLLAPRGFKFENFDSDYSAEEEDAYIYYPKTGKFYNRYLNNIDGMEGAGSDSVLGIRLGERFMKFHGYYFPDDDVMLIPSDGGLDASYNFRTGDIGAEVGNPNDWLYSPSKRYRVNSDYSFALGNSYYYLQKRIAPGQYRLIDGANHYFESFTLPFCTPEKSFWDGDRVLYLIKTIPDWLLKQLGDDAEEYIKANKDQYWRVTIKNNAK